MNIVKKRGVKFRKDRGKWSACIIYQGKRIYLGNFEKAENAMEAYDKKALEIYGDRAITNKSLNNKKECPPIPENPILFKYRGVKYDKTSGVWTARIKHQGIPIWLGTFYKLKDAINAYDMKAIELQREDAITNKLLIENGHLPPITDKFDKLLPDISDLPNEIWADIKGYENIYMVSNMGRIKSLAREGVPETQILIPAKDKKGYLSGHLCNENGAKFIKLHRLVALAFIPNPNNLPQINHKDLNKENNKAENLEWSTNLDNMKHACRNRVYTDTPLNDEQIREIRKLKLTGLHTQTEIGRMLGVSQGRISQIVRNITYKHVI